MSAPKANCGAIAGSAQVSVMARYLPGCQPERNTKRETAHSPASRLRVQARSGLFGLNGELGANIFNLANLHHHRPTISVSSTKKVYSSSGT